MLQKKVNYYDWLDEFIEDKQASGLSEYSLKSYYYAIDRYLKSVDTGVINKASFNAFINSITGAVESKKHYARSVRAFVYWAIENKELEPFKISLPKGQEPELKIPSTEDIEKLLVKPTSKSFSEYRNWVIVNLIVSTGLRCRSIINIKLTDIDLNNQTIAIRETKNKKILVLPLTDELCKILNKYIKKYELGEYLFPTDGAQKLSVDGLKSSYKRYARKRLVEYTGLHALRHYFATEATRNGMSAFTLQKVLGHSDISITMKYVNLVSDDIKSELLRFNPLNKKGGR